MSSFSLKPITTQNLAPYRDTTMRVPLATPHHTTPPRDVHDYDGKLKEVKAILDSELIRIYQIPIEYRIAELKNYTPTITKYTTPMGVSAYTTIVHTGAKSANYDPSNELDAFDLLWLCYEQCVEDSDFLAILGCQLEDMAVGMCAQGRTTRLFQLVYAIL